MEGESGRYQLSNPELDLDVGEMFEDDGIFNRQEQSGSNSTNLDDGSYDLMKSEEEGTSGTVSPATRLFASLGISDIVHEGETMRKSEDVSQTDEQTLFPVNDEDDDTDCEEMTKYKDPGSLKKEVDKRFQEEGIGAHKEFKTIFIRELNIRGYITNRDIDFFLLGVNMMMKVSYFKEMNDLLESMRVENEKVKKVGKELEAKKTSLIHELKTISGVSDNMIKMSNNLSKPQMSLTPGKELILPKYEEGKKPMKTIIDDNDYGEPSNMVEETLKVLGFTSQSAKNSFALECARKFFTKSQMLALIRGISDSGLSNQKRLFTDFVKKQKKPLQS